MRYIKKALGAIVIVSAVFLLGAVGECEQGGDLMNCTARMLFALGSAITALFAYGAIEHIERKE